MSSFQPNAFQVNAFDAIPPATAQAQASIKSVITNNQSQAQADIRVTTNRSGQANADVKATTTRSAQAQAKIGAVRISQEAIEVAILPTDANVLVSQLAIETLVNSTTTNILVSQLAVEVLLKAFTFGWGQAQASIRVTSTGSGQAQTYVGHFQSGQAQARILATVSRSGQAQAKLIAFDVPQSGQAQAYIRSNVVFGQAQASIRVTSTASGQAIVYVGHFKFGQAQARIIAFNVPASGQAQAVIVRIVQNFGLALAAIDHGGHGNAQALIKRTQNSTGNAFAYILPPTFWGQAQARLIAFDVNSYGQANADIQKVTTTIGQAQAKITKTQGTGNAQADIKSTRGRASGQALAYIGHFQSGQAQAFIIKNQVHGQAQASIRVRTFGFGQCAGAAIRPEKSGQAQAQIVQTYTQSGQAAALIDDRFVWGQAQASIVHVYTQSAQAKALIKTTARFSGQANAMISVRHYASGQAQVMITERTIAMGQAMACIGTYGWGQAQAQLLAFDYPRHAQAQAYIVANGTITQPGPNSGSQTYLVKFNNYTLPGYAQDESYDSIENIFTANSPYQYKTLSEYTGLVNKEITLRMRVWEADYEACKEQVKKAATMLRSAKSFVKLYIGSYDSYFMAVVKTIKIQKDVAQGQKTLDYEITFEAKPWEYSNDVYEVSGTDTLITTGRTLYDGTWTPVRIITSGENVTISGLTDDGLSTGLIQLTGVVKNVIIDTEQFTVQQVGYNKLDTVVNKDFSLYVGPKVTTFTVTGATSLILQYQNRWVLPKGNHTSAQAVATSIITDIKPVDGELIDGVVAGLARAFIVSPIHNQVANVQALIESPIKSQHGNARAAIRQTRFIVNGNAQALISSPRKIKNAQAQAFIHINTTRTHGQARTYIKRFKVSAHGLARAFIHAVVTGSPSGVPLPVNNPTGWIRMFEDDFNGTIPEGSFLAMNGKWTAYPDGWTDTSGNGHYTPNVFSTHGGMLDVYMRMINGLWRVGTLRPILPVSANYHKKVRVEVRFKADPTLGFKTAWLLWPDNTNWPYDGEIDFPEGDLNSFIHGYVHREGATAPNDQDAYATTGQYTSWHTAVTEWEMGVYCKFYLDGVLIGNSTSRVPSTPMHYDLQSETRLSGGPPPAGAAAHIYVDWIVLWTKP